MSLARSSLFFAAGTLLSRLSGLARDRILLSVFGASDIMSGFVVAFRIPNMLREMLAEGALGSSFTKVYTSLDSEDGFRARQLLIDALILMSVVALFTCLLGMVAAPFIVNLMTSKAEGGPVLIATATGLTRVLFPFLAFMMLGAIATGALHKRGRFFLSSASPILFNGFNIFGALVIAPWLVASGPDFIEVIIADKAITGLAIGVLLGGLGQLFLQIIDLKNEIKQGLREWKSHSILSSDVRKMLLLMAPMALAAGGGQVKTVINNYFATTAGPSAVVWLDSAFRLLHLPIGLFGVAISAAVLPSLTRAITKAGGVVDRRASDEMQNAVELVLWLMTPCFVYMVVHHLELVQCLYQSGRFKAHDAEQTSHALFAYSFALVAYGLSKVLTSFYFALERTKFALYVSLSNIALNLLANWLMVEKFGHTGLAWGYSLTQTVIIVPMIVGLRGVTLNKLRFTRSLVLLCMASMIAGFGMSIDKGILPKGQFPIWASSGIILLCNGIFCVIVYGFCAMWYLKQSPKSILKAIKAKAARK